MYFSETTIMPNNHVLFIIYKDTVYFVQDSKDK